MAVNIPLAMTQAEANLALSLAVKLTRDAAGLKKDGRLFLTLKVCQAFMPEIVELVKLGYLGTANPHPLHPAEVNPFASPRS